ncbi:MAG: SRPBCC domain-containing protein [Chloroflexota bacterium]
MMNDEFTLTVEFHTSAEEIYKAFLSTQGHTRMTGSPAKVDGHVNGKFTAWDGYIWGTFLELEKNKKIVQAWRTSEFPEDAEDSRVEILLEEIETGLDTPRKARGYSTTITLKHTNIPEGQAEGYKTGWEDFYFKPMREFFG